MTPDYEAGVQYEGHVKFWDDNKGYGFISCEGRDDIFAHISSVTGKKRLPEDTEVKFTTERGPKGWRTVEVIPS